MPTVYNFSAGPAVLPQAVLRQAAAELPDWHGTGMSVMEMSHRGRDFVAIAEAAEARLRELMAIGEDYRVLFLQGGATGQFAAIPMNLSHSDAAADYVITGNWGKRAHAEGARYLDRVNVAAAASPATYVPPAWPGGGSPRTRTSCTSRSTRPSRACASTRCPTPARSRWSRTSAR